MTIQGGNAGLASSADSIQGVGLGLRSPHFSTILKQQPEVPWFEALIDNYMVDGGPALRHLEQVRRDYPLTFHAVGMSLGASTPLNVKYLNRLRSLINRFEPVYVSDHLCWNTVNDVFLHDLLPLPYDQAVVQHVADRIKQVQDVLDRRLLLENVSSYLSYRISVIEEWEFLVRIVELADCDILLDINNIYVSAFNHGFDADIYIDAIPAERVREFHLAGFEDQGRYLLDTHGEAVHAPVWDLYRKALQRFGPVPTLVEWDNNIPDFEILYGEGLKARRVIEEECRDAA